MANAVLSTPVFHNETAAFTYVEARMWPNGPVCPHCDAKADKIGALNARTKPSKKNPEGSIRHGLRKCYACRKEFTVRVGTIFEDSHLPLHLWMQAIHLLSSSKKGISTRQIQRLLNCSMKTAWFLTHRIREIMKPAGGSQMGGSGKVVEVDETYFGNLPEYKMGAKRHGRPFRSQKRGPSHKRAILSLVERGGEARSFYVERAELGDVVKIVRENVSKESRLHTDESYLYKTVGREFEDHETVVHSRKEYARGDVTTNTVEGFYSIFKRGMRGVYQHCSEAHLHRYLAEFDFRYSNREKLGVNDTARTGAMMRNAKGRRLTYGGPRSAQPSLT